MRADQQPVPRLRRAAAVVLGIAVALSAGGPAAAEEGDAAKPQLSIKVDNGRTSTSTGEKMDYTVRVRNIGAVAVPGLRVTQSVPKGHTFTSADAGGTGGTENVSWTVDLGTTMEATFHSTMTVSGTSPELLRLATVACAHLSADGPPIVCASHSDQLPAGAAADRARAGAPDEGAAWMYMVLTGLVGVVLVAASARLTRRRTTPQRNADW